MLARFRCPFASLNEVIPHRFPKRAFHWSHKPQSISHPWPTDVYARERCHRRYLQQRAFLTAAGRLGSAMQLHHDARGNRALPSTPSSKPGFVTCYCPLQVSPPGKSPPQRSFALNLSFLQKGSNTRLCGARPHGIDRPPEPLEERHEMRRWHTHCLDRG